MNAHGSLATVVGAGGSRHRCPRGWQDPSYLGDSQREHSSDRGLNVLSADICLMAGPRFPRSYQSRYPRSASSNP
jgi:hypothetical protein